MDRRRNSIRRLGWGAALVAVAGCSGELPHSPPTPAPPTEAQPEVAPPVITPFVKSEHNPVLPRGAPGTFDARHAEYPGVFEADGVLWMYYSAYGLPRWSIGGATSADGIAWQKFGEVLTPSSEDGAWDSATIAFPEVMHAPRASQGERFRMYYAGKDDAPYTGIGLAVSADGLRWERRGRVLGLGGAADWDRGQIVDPSVMDVGGEYRMYYCGSTSTTALFAIGVAFSDDGVQWRKYEKNPVYALGDGSEEAFGLYTVAVVHVQGRFILFEASPRADGTYAIFATASHDGLFFEHRDRKVVLEPSGDHGWDHLLVYGMEVVVDGDQMSMWFNGIKAAGPFQSGQIGLARARVGAVLEYLDEPTISPQLSPFRPRFPAPRLPGAATPTP